MENESKKNISNGLKKVIILIIVFTVICIVFIIYSNKSNNGSLLTSDNVLDTILEKYPNLFEYTEKVKLYNQKIIEDPFDVENYLTLGLQWKGIADRVDEIEKNKYYQQALDVYLDGINITQRKNSISLYNAGKMNEFLKQYAEAEDYYKEAISIDPGNGLWYITLADLYQYKMQKTSEEIIEIYDWGIERVIGSEVIKKEKQDYLNSIKKGSEFFGEFKTGQ